MGAEADAGGGQSPGEQALSREIARSSRRSPGDVGPLGPAGSAGQSPGEQALSGSFGGVTDQAIGDAEQGPGVRGGVTINVNPQLVSPAPVSTTREPAPSSAADTTTGLGGGQPSGRRRARAGTDTLLTPGLADTAKKVLLGQ